MSSIVEQRFFSKFDAVLKNNKYWNITLFDDGSVEVHFGPQGQDGQRKMFPAGHVKSGRSGFDSYIREKTSPRKGYTENRVLEAVKSDLSTHVMASKHELANKAINDIANGQPELQKLLKYFADVNAHNLFEASGGKITYNSTTGLFSTTQGVVTLDQIREARDLLDSIAIFSNQGVFNSDSFFAKVNPYLSLIPQEGLVRKMNFEEMFGSAGLQKQTDILDGLETSYASAISSPKQIDQKNGDDAAPMFKVTLDRVNLKSEFDEVRDLYRRTKGGHRDVSDYDVYTVYRLKINAMADAFEKIGKKIGNIKRLWHGTKASNVLSILKSGFFLPRSGGTIQITGNLYGAGLYFSDQSTKSIRYATGAWGGGGATDRKFMFLADVAMGKSYIPTGSYSFRMPKGYDSCFAKANISGVLNNEMIVYNTAQANPVYIIEFTPYGK